MLLDGAWPEHGASAPAVTLCQGEVTALQVLVRGPAHGVTVEVNVPGVTAERFVEHALEVSVRSRGPDPDESLGWLPGARPADDELLGLVPDALLPVEHAPPWRPYPLVIPDGQLGAVWVDMSAATVGRHQGEIVVAAGNEAVHLPLTVDLADCELPRRVVNVMAYLDAGAVAARTQDPASLAAAWRLLGAHGVDPLADLSTPEDAQALAPGLAGDWFDDHHHPFAVAIGAYGALGDPSAQKARLALALTRAVPADVLAFVYAIDEVCPTPRAASWRGALAAVGAPPTRPLVGQTCGRDYPAVDLVMVPADAWRRQDSQAAAAAGRKLWLYNGRLPRTPTMLLDAPPAVAVALGWIAASRRTGPWFLWEVAFWDDGNKGGHGPVDPFATAETFHNAHGDAALGDGLLIYPGHQAQGLDPGVGGVLPSMRLKRLRRGLQDAGLLALAAAADPRAARAIADKVIPLALDEVSAEGRTPWATDPQTYVNARAELRALIRPGARLNLAAARSALDRLASVKPLPHPAAARIRGWRRVFQVLIATAVGAIAAAAFAMGLRRFERAPR